MCVCIESNLTSPAVRRDHVDSSRPPVNQGSISSTITLRDIREGRNAVGTITEQGQLVQITDTSRSSRCARSQDTEGRDLRRFEIRFVFESAILIQFHSKVMGQFEKIFIGRACPLLVVVKRLKPLTVLSGTVYRLASSMSDHTPVLFNVFEDWNEESVIYSCMHLFYFICN